MNRLSPHQRVWFSGGHPRLSAVEWHVVAIVGDVAALEPARANAAGGLPDVDDTFMCFEHRGGAVSLRGRLFRGDFEDDWRFALTDGVQQRRTRPFRIELCAPVSLQTSHGTVETQVLDIGIDGCRLAAAEGVVPGGLAQISLSLPGYDEPIEATGRFDDWGEDLVFSHLDDPTHARLATFLIVYQRMMWRRRLALAQLD